MTNRIYMIVLSILNVLTSFLLILQVYLFRNIIDNAVNHISLKQVIISNDWIKNCIFFY